MELASSEVILGYGMIFVVKSATSPNATTSDRGSITLGTMCFFHLWYGSPAWWASNAARSEYISNIYTASGSDLTDQKSKRKVPGSRSLRDLLWLDGISLLDEAQIDRRRLLQYLSDLSGGAVVVTPSFAGVDLADVLAACEALDLEGVVLKRHASRYRPGRSRDWRKVKTAAWRDVHLPRRQKAMHGPGITLPRLPGVSTPI